MRILNVHQGTPEWHAERRKRRTASQAPVMMGASPHQTRDQLLLEVKTGVEKERDSYVENVVFARGHEVEEFVRTRVEAELGKDFFPVTAVGDNGLLASLDGLDMAETEILEVKQWNKVTAEKYRQTGKLDPEHYWQCEQQLAVVDTATHVRWIMSDGKGGENEIVIIYKPVRGRRKKLMDGWARFNEDLQHVEVPEPAKKAEAQAIATLPALEVQVSAAHVLASNLDAFKIKAQDYIDGINTKLESDQDFANAEADVKFCQKAEKDLTAVVERIVNSSASVTDVINTIEGIREQLRQKRLGLDKLVKSEKQARKNAIVVAGQEQVDGACAELSVGLNGYAIDVPVSWAEVTYGLKTLDSIQSKVNDAVADAKIRASNVAQLVRKNLEAIPEVSLHLFPDFPSIGDKAVDDFQRIVNERLEKEREKVAKAAEKPDPIVASEEVVRGDIDISPPLTIPQKTGFEDWWSDTGSGIQPAAGEDTEAFAKRICRIAWNAATEPF